MTYGAQVWYTGIRQSGLVQWLQIAQNEGIQKISGTFHTTPIEPLHNLTAIPPISYLLPKLINAYTRRLGGMNPRAMVWSILDHDQCQYWPEYVVMNTNLTRASAGVAVITYRPLDPCKTGRWSPRKLAYIPNPPPFIIEQYKDSLCHCNASDTHIFIHPHTSQAILVATYITQRGHDTIHTGTK
jgi:hypothetical protein